MFKRFRFFFQMPNGNFLKQLQLLMGRFRVSQMIFTNSLKQSASMCPTMACTRLVHEF